MTYSQLLQHLLKLQLISLRDMPAPPEMLPTSYDVNARCKYHSGGVGHNTERCFALKNKVQDLIESKAIQFTPNNAPNVTQNPMPPHTKPGVNAIERAEDSDVVNDVNSMIIPLTSVKAYLAKNGIFPGCVPDCQKCEDQFEGCSELKKKIQELMDIGFLQFSKVMKKDDEVVVISIPYDPVDIPTPVEIPEPTEPAALTITIPGPVPYSSEKAVPWHYGSKVYYLGIKKGNEESSRKEPVENDSANVDNFAGVGRMTRSGRVLSPRNVQEVVDALDKAKGKQAMTNNGVPIPNPVIEVSPSTQYVEELLKIIRKSDYKIVDQLGQTPSKILIMSLLLCSEVHRNALMKLLNTAYVPHEISVNQFENVVANISAGNGLGFTDSDLPPEGKAHNKALHISIECKGTTLSRVLVDTGSSLNVLPKSALMRIDYAGVEIRPSELIVKAFDGSRRSVFGEVDLPIKVGPQIFTTTFYVMDIQPAYYCLLGRPWIHKAGAVTSTLHQRIKYPTEGKIITVCGEEEYLVSHLTSFRYMEIEGEYHETPFQAFEAVHMIKTPQTKKSEAPMSSLKDAKAVVESEQSNSWGHVIEVSPKLDKFCLGFKGKKSDMESGSSSLSTPVKFSSAGTIQDCNINAVDNENDGFNIDNWIRPSIPDIGLNNWTSMDVVQVTSTPE